MYFFGSLSFPHELLIHLMYSPSFSLLICLSLYHSVNEVKLSTSHKGSNIFLFLNVGSNVHCLVCKGTCPQWSWMVLCVCVCVQSRGSPPPFSRQRPQFVTSCTAVDRVSSVCMCTNVPICVCVQLCEIGGRKRQREVGYPFLPQCNLSGHRGGVGG